MMKNFVPTCLASLLASLAITQSLSASLINIDTVLVGDAGNPNDSTVILPRKAVRGFLKERPENGTDTKQVCAAV
jgi:hypothetical protein